MSLVVEVGLGEARRIKATSPVSVPTMGVGDKACNDSDD